MAVLLLGAPPVSAHPFLIRTLPAAGYAIAKTPPQIGLVFDEEVTFDSDAIVVDGQARGKVSTSAPIMLRDDRTLVVRPDRPLPRGRYTVHWQVVSPDGHSVSGSFGFGVGVTASTVEDAETETPGLPAAVGFRWMVFAGLTLALGGLVGDRLVRWRLARAKGRPLTVPRPWLVGGSLVGACGAFGLAVHQVGGGSLVDGVRGFSLPALLSSHPGRMVALEVLAFAVAALTGARRCQRLTGLALLSVVAGEAGRNHVYTEAGAAGWLVVAVHLAAAATWVGALIHVCRTAFRWRDSPGDARALFVGYAMLAAVLYTGVVLTGILGAVLVLPSATSLVTTSYGLVLVAKLMLLLAASALAFVARRRLLSDRMLGPGLGITAYTGGERASLVGVLAVAGVLSSIPTPAPTPTDELAYPPPLHGDAVRVGALTGQVNVGLVAAQRHLEVHLATPETDPTTDQPFQLHGRLTSPDAPDETLDFEPCGTGCFYAAPRWRRGANLVELTVSAAGWHGGQARLEVPWPIRERAQLLDRVLDFLARQRSIIVREAVSSDTSRPVPLVTTNPISAQEFLQNTPYKSGKVGTVTMLGREGPNTWIGFGSQAQRVYARLLVAPNGRLLRERIVSPRHLIRHNLAYSGAR